MKRSISACLSSLGAVARRTSPGETWNAGLTKLSVSVASVAAPLLAGSAARAEWVRGSIVWINDYRHDYVQSAYAPYTTASATLAITSNSHYELEASASGSGTTTPPTVGATARVAGNFTQNFVWQGTGTPTSTFTVDITGTLDASYSGNGSSVGAESTADGPVGTATVHQNVTSLPLSPNPSAHVIMQSSGDPTKASIKTYLKAEAGGGASGTSQNFTAHALTKMDVGAPY